MSKYGLLCKTERGAYGVNHQSLKHQQTVFYDQQKDIIMSHIALTKITKINAQILELETEKKAMSDKLNQTLLTLISQSAIEDVDFETRVGGLLFIQKTLQSNDIPDQKQKDIWKKEGALYLSARKKTTKQNIGELSKE